LVYFYKREKIVKEKLDPSELISAIRKPSVSGCSSQSLAVSN